MVRYLSDEWMSEAAEALRSTTTPPEGEVADGSLWIRYEISGGPDGKCVYSIGVDENGISLEPRPVRDAAASFALDYDTATAVAKGELSAQVAFMQGRLKLGGDINVLIRQHELLDGLADALSQLRERTEF